MPSFAFAGLPTTLPLVTGTGTLALSVQNLTPRRLAGRATVWPLGQARPAWFGFEGAPPTDPARLDLEFAPGATGTLRLRVAPPPDAPPGRYVFAVRVGATDDDPDNDFVESPAVAFDVAPRAAVPSPPKPAFPWWIVAVAVAVLLLGGGAAWWLTRGTSGGSTTVGNPGFTLVNNAERPIVEVYVVPAGSPDWGRPLLGGERIPVGGRSFIQLPRGLCVNDLRVRLDDSTESARRGVNTCEARELSWP